MSDLLTTLILLNRAMRNCKIVDKLHTESERYGMHINVVKTKTVVFGKKSQKIMMLK